MNKEILTKKTYKPDWSFNNSRFDFSLSINENIICQKFFDINNFNEESLNSLELKEIIDNIMSVNYGKYCGAGIITQYFKEKTLDYLWNSFNPGYLQQYYHIEQQLYGKNNFEKDCMFIFKFSVDKKIVCTAELNANYFPSDIRQYVDIRKLIPDIIKELQCGLSQEKYTLVSEN